MEAGTGGRSVAPVDVAARLRRTAAARPDHAALIWADGTRTYAELDTRADAATAALQDLGVQPGDRVAFVLGTTPTFVEAAAAVLRAGATMVPLLPGLAPDELRFALVDSGAKVAVLGPERGAEVVALRGELPQVEHLITVDGSIDGSLVWEELLDAAGTPSLGEREPDDLAALVYTSGTTGRPRGAMLTRANLAANQDQSLAGRFEVNADDLVLLVLPMAHIYSLNVGLGASVTAGATMVLIERFDPLAVLRTIERDRVTVLLGAPPMYVAWLESGALPDADLSSVRLAVSGAAPLPVQIYERFEAATGIRIEEGYGLTEASPSVTANSMGPEPRPGSVGLPLPGIQLRLVDDDGHDVVRGDPGEVWVRGPNVFQGYWNDAEATDRVLTPDGWLRTGDVGTQDEDGYLYLVDRKRDLIIVNGFNVYPREVERVLLEDDRVGQAAVIGAPHPLSGETVIAFVVPRSGAEVDTDALMARCRERIARYKSPSRIEVTDHLPHTATGKLRRRELRDDDPGA